MIKMDEMDLHMMEVMKTGRDFYIDRIDYSINVLENLFDEKIKEITQKGGTDEEISMFSIGYLQAILSLKGVYRDGDVHKDDLDAKIMAMGAINDILLKIVGGKEK